MSFGNSIKYKLDNNLIAVNQTTKVIKENFINFIKVKQTVNIGVVGTERHIGATTLAINLTKYLSELTNIRACYKVLFYILICLLLTIGTTVLVNSELREQLINIINTNI